MAQRMRESKQSIPHFYLQTSVNAEPMIARRAAAASDKIAWDAFFVSAIGKTLKKFERMCFRFEGDHLAAGGTDAVGVAVDNEGELYVIAVTDPAVKTPERISGEIRSAVEQLRAGDQEVRKLRPANMTVTNLGAANVETFTAIINPPEAAILAVGKVSPRAVVENGKIVVQNRVSITLSVDHRVVNGKYAADFLGGLMIAVNVSTLAAPRFVTVMLAGRNFRTGDRGHCAPGWCHSTPNPESGHGSDATRV